MTFKEKGSVTEEDKENFYNEIKDKFSMSDDDISELKQRDISMHAETEKIVEPGESAKKYKLLLLQRYLLFKRHKSL